MIDKINQERYETLKNNLNKYFREFMSIDYGYFTELKPSQMIALKGVISYVNNILI